MSPPGTTVASFELCVAPDAILDGGPHAPHPRPPAIIPTVRRFVAELCRRVVADAEITSKVMVATHELLDNAVRYASRDISGIRVELQRHDEGIGVVIVTRNRISDDRRRELSTVIDELRKSPDRGGFFQKLLYRAARRTDGAGLGLGRVHAEADLELSSRYEGDIVVVRAEGRFPLTPAR